MGKKFTIIIEETVSQTFEIEAETEDAAIEIGTAKYKNGEIVLEPGDLQEARICVLNEQGEYDKWAEI